MKPWPMKACRALPAAPSVSSTFEAMTMTPLSRASEMIWSKALLSTIEVISASGPLASAASMLADCWSIEPSVWVNTIWQFASIFAQASSKPFLTACQNGLEADEWWVKTMFIGSAALAAPAARPMRECRRRDGGEDAFHSVSSLWFLRCRRRWSSAAWW